MRLQVSTSPAHALLDLYSTGKCGDDAWKFGENSVAHELNDSSLVFGYFGLDQFPTDFRQSSHRAGFVISHQSAVTDNVSSKDGT